MRDRFYPYRSGQRVKRGWREKKSERLERVPLVLKGRKDVQSLLTFAPCLDTKVNYFPRRKPSGREKRKEKKRSEKWVDPKRAHCFDVTRYVRWGGVLGLGSTSHQPLSLTRLSTRGPPYSSTYSTVSRFKPTNLANLA